MGILCATIWILLSYAGINLISGLQLNVLDFNLMSYLGGSAFVFAILFCLLFINTGFIYRTPIIHLLCGEFIEEEFKMKVPGINFLVYFVYLLPFVVYLFTTPNVYTHATFMLFAMVDIAGILGLVLPKKLRKVQEKNYLNQVNSMAYGNLISYLKKDALLINMITVSLLAITLIVGFLSQDQAMLVIVLFILFAMFCIITFSLLYRLNTQAFKQIPYFKTLYQIGFHRDTIHNIISKTIKLDFFIILLFSSIHIIVMLLVYVIKQMVHPRIVAFIICSIPVVFIGIEQLCGRFHKSIIES